MHFCADEIQLIVAMGSHVQTAVQLGLAWLVDRTRAAVHHTRLYLDEAEDECNGGTGRDL